MKPAVLTYMDEMSRLGTVLMGAIVKSLGVESTAFGEQFNEPTVLFRMFHYPPHNPTKFNEKSVGVGEHTDYGYLTILKQDDSGGLQAKTPVRGKTARGVKVKSADERPATDLLEWIDVPPIRNTFVVNLGDSLQHNTGGLLLATTHRVQQRTNATTSRYSFPFFFDPSFSAQMQSVQELLTSEDKMLATRNRELLERVGRWDMSDPTRHTGSYGNYLVGKVAKVFPALALRVNLTGSVPVQQSQEVTANGGE
ncbi:unnamed protein product [Symbiodinium microadriaticum]|nr:unnamed protein product [Symbiodinium microadriaticum]